MRQTHQAAKINIKINNVERMKELICDGVLVSSSIPIISPALNLVSRPLTFGVHSSFNWSHYLGGNLDNVQLWDNPLSSQEIGQYITYGIPLEGV